MLFLKIALAIIVTLLFVRFIWLAKLSLDPLADASFYWLRAYIVLILSACGIAGFLALIGLSVIVILRTVVIIAGIIWGALTIISTVKWKDFFSFVAHVVLLLIPIAVLLFL